MPGSALSYGFGGRVSRLALGGGLVYPDVVVARGKQAVWDLANTAQPRFSATSFATNNAGTSSALPTGAEYRTSSGQRYVVVTGNAVNLSRWEFRIPVINIGGAGSPNLFTDARFLASEIAAGPNYRNLYNGYDQIAGTLHPTARAICDYCLLDYGDGPVNATGLSAQIQNGMYLDGANFNFTSELTITNSRIDRALAAHLISYAATTLDDNFFGGFGLHPTDSDVHSEAVWIAAGVNKVRGNRMDASGAADLRLPNTWTGYVYANARWGQMDVELTGNIGHGGGDESGVAVQWGVHPSNPGTLGVIDYSDNIWEPKPGSAMTALTNFTNANFDAVYDNYDFVSGDADGTFIPVIPGAPVISTPSSVNINENAPLAISLAANELIASWAIRTAAQDAASVDHAQFEISGTTLRWAGNGTKDYEAPNDSGSNNTYVVVVRATDNTGETADHTITVTVTDVAEFERVQFENSDIFRSASSAHGMASGTSRMGLLFFTLQMPASIPGTTITLFGNVGGVIMSIQILAGSGKVRVNLFDNAASTWRIESIGDECNGQFKTFVVTADISLSTPTLGSQMWRHDGSAWADVRFTTATWPAIAGRTLNWGSAQQWQIGATNFARQFEKLGLRPASTFDATVLANRDKLLDPAVLLSNGSGADGTAPNIYLHGPAATWNAGHNNGSGAVFSAVGGITVTDV